MAPTEAQEGAPYLVAVVVGSLIVLLTGAFVVAVIEYYLINPRRRVIRDPKRYREWNKLRKEWNKAAAMEGRRRFIMLTILGHKIEEQGLSEEDRFRYTALVRDTYELKVIMY